MPIAAIVLMLAGLGRCAYARQNESAGQQGQARREHQSRREWRAGRVRPFRSEWNEAAAKELEQRSLGDPDRIVALRA
jgi:hypothetical protein